jgi:hypothetical protein
MNAMFLKIDDYTFTHDESITLGTTALGMLLNDEVQAFFKQWSMSCRNDSPVAVSMDLGLDDILIQAEDFGMEITDSLKQHLTTIFQRPPEAIHAHLTNHACVLKQRAIAV